MPHSEPHRTYAPVHIRLASNEDADGILAVYAPYIATPITFEDEVPATSAFRARVADIREGYPYLVAETLNDAGATHIVGYAYAHAQHPRAAYRWNAELSVYLAPDARGRKLGTILYEALIELLRAQGIKAVYGLVTAPNPASDALHRAFGFDVMGVQPFAGFKSGAWHGVTWYVKQLADHEAEPADPVPFPRLLKERPHMVEQVLSQANDACAHGMR